MPARDKLLKMCRRGHELRLEFLSEANQRFIRGEEVYDPDYGDEEVENETPAVLFPARHSHLTIYA